MRWRRASFGLAFLAMAAVAVAIAVRGGGPAQPLAASTATVAPEAAPTVAPTLTPETAPSPTATPIPQVEPGADLERAASRELASPTATPIPQVEPGADLEGGRTYALGGAWIFDVPEGMRLWHTGGPLDGFSFKDRVTGSLITIYLRPDGSLDFYGLNYGSTPAARELADAWLPAIEASVRRPPGYVYPPPTPALVVPGPGANPDGVPYLRDSDLHEEVFEGGRTYATPDDKWLVDVPDGLSVRFHENTQAVPACLTAASCGEAVDTYLFDAVGIFSSVYISKTTGKRAGRIGDVNAQMDALAASFKSVRAMRWRRASFGLAFLAMAAVAVAIAVRAGDPAQPLATPTVRW